MNKEYNNIITIIGNGFDLAHNCNTDYRNFIEYIERL